MCILRNFLIIFLPYNYSTVSQSVSEEIKAKITPPTKGVARLTCVKLNHVGGLVARDSKSLLKLDYSSSVESIILKPEGCQ